MKKIALKKRINWPKPPCLLCKHPVFPRVHNKMMRSIGFVFGDAAVSFRYGGMRSVEPQSCKKHSHFKYYWREKARKWGWVIVANDNWVTNYVYTPPGEN